MHVCKCACFVHMCKRVHVCVCVCVYVCVLHNVCVYVIILQFYWVYLLGLFTIDATPPVVQGVAMANRKHPSGALQL